MENKELLQAMRQIVREEIQPLKEGMEDVKTRLTNVEWETRRASGLIENEVQPNIRILAEAHSGMVEKLDKVDFDEVNETVDIIKSLVRDEVLVRAK